VEAQEAGGVIMSFKYTTAVFEAQLPLVEKAILDKLAHRANENGVCWPGQSRIAKDAGCSYSTVQRALDCLIGHYRVVKVSGQRPLRNSTGLFTNEYTLDLQRIIELATVVVRPPVKETVGGKNTVPRATTTVGGEPPLLVAERGHTGSSLTDKAVIKPDNKTERETATECAAAVATFTETILKEEERELLEQWYGKRLKKSVSEVELGRIQQDLPFIQELINSVNGDSRRLLSFVFSDPGEGNWAGWDKKSLNLPALLKHIRKGDLLAQFRDAQETPSPVSPLCDACKKPAENFTEFKVTYQTEPRRYCEACMAEAESGNPPNPPASSHSQPTARGIRNGKVVDIPYNPLTVTLVDDI
jgi:Helix-turn-helix domain